MILSRKFFLRDDPQEYSLTFDYNAICDVETETGVNLMALLSRQSLDSNQTRAMLYACLKPGHPDVTLKEAGGLLSREMETVLDSLLPIIQAGRGDELTEEEENREGESTPVVPARPVPDPPAVVSAVASVLVEPPVEPPAVPTA